MGPTAVIDSEHTIVFLERHDAMTFWRSLSNRSDVLVIDMVEDPSGGWIVPTFH
jgi:hypothetical protein